MPEERTRPIRSLKLPKGGLTRFSLRPLIPKLRLTRSQMQTLPRTASFRRLNNPPQDPPPRAPSPIQQPPRTVLETRLPQNSRKRRRSESQQGASPASIQSSSPVTPVLKRPLRVFDLLGEEQEISAELETALPRSSPAGSKWRGAQESARLLPTNGSTSPREPHRPPLRVSNSNSPRRLLPPPPSPHQKEASSARIGQSPILRRSGAGGPAPENTSPPDRKRMRAQSTGGARGTENLPRVGHPALLLRPSVKNKPEASARPSRRPKVRH